MLERATCRFFVVFLTGLLYTLPAAAQHGAGAGEWRVY